VLPLRDGVALQAYSRLRSAQQATVRRTVRRVTTHAVIHHGGVLEYLWPADRLVAAEALFAPGFQHSVAAAMRIMATRTGHPAFLHRVMGSHLELRIGILMALDAHRRVLVGLVGGEAQTLAYRRAMYGMAVAADAAGLVVLAERPVHQLSVVLVACRAFRAFRKGDGTLSGLPLHEALAMHVSTAVTTFATPVIVIRLGSHPLDITVAGDATEFENILPCNILHAFLGCLGWCR